MLYLAALSLLAWIYLFFFHGGFWRLRGLQPPAFSPESSLARVVAIVPARNEAEVIAESLASLLAQQFSGKLDVVVVDDNSSDGTAAIARASAEAHGANGRLHVIAGLPLPPGWSGKVWAMHQGVAAAREFGADYVLFTDADIAHAPQGLERLLALAKREDRDLVSQMVRLHCATLPERLLIPAFVYFFFLLYPPRWILSRGSSAAGAAGGCILVRFDMLERAGGLESIRGEVIDDCALARRVKGAGGSLWLGLADETRSVRVYESYGEIHRMIARTAFNQLRHSWLLLLGCLLGLSLLFLVPIAALFPADPGVRTIGLLTLLLMFATYLPLCRYYKLSRLHVLTLPLAAILYMAAAVDSAIGYAAGRGGQWKGRAQDV